MGIRDAAGEDRSQQAPMPPSPPAPDINDDLPEDQPKGRYPKRYWTAGPGSPQTKLVPAQKGIGGKGKKITKSMRPLKPRYYAYTVNSKEEEDFLLNSAMGRRVWEEDLEEDEQNVTCEECGYSCRSNRAMLAHYKTHKRGGSNLARIRAVPANALS